MGSSSVENSLAKLRDYVEAENHKGYDPYDTLNAKLNFSILGKWGPVLAIQVQKRNPINIRKLIGIEKEYNPKAMGLFLHTYSLLYRHNPTADNKNKMNFFYRWLLKNYTKGYKGYCWGYNFDWASPGKYLKAHSPTIVVSGFISKGIFEYYQATKDPKAVEILKSIGEFVLHDLPITEDDTGTCFSYSTTSKDCCYNASLLGAELFARLYYITQENKYLNSAKKATDFVIARQHEDGHWNYSVDVATGKERQQIDFHQGYVLDSIFYFLKYTGVKDEKYDMALKRGAEYYLKEQFFKNGRSIWRVPKVWPVEIHNQSQGIITFSRLMEYDSNYLKFAGKIASWTIANMQHKTGYFYYRKFPVYTIRTSMMRWSQAWMFLALTEILISIQKDEN